MEKDSKVKKKDILGANVVAKTGCHGEKREGQNGMERPARSLLCRTLYASLSSIDLI